MPCGCGYRDPGNAFTSQGKPEMPGKLPDTGRERHGTGSFHSP